jgi:hypothetical protein
MASVRSYGWGTVAIWIIIVVAVIAWQTGIFERLAP